MCIYLHRHSIDAFRSHLLRTECNHSRGWIVMVWILLLPKSIDDCFVISRHRHIITRRGFLKEERQYLICSPSLGDKDVIDVMQRKLLINVHEILAKLNPQTRAIPIFRQDNGVSREDTLYLFPWHSKSKHHKR